MTHQWFSPEDAIWFASAGVLSLTALAAPIIARGRHKRLIVGTWGVTIVAGMILLVAGVIAVLEGQPGHVVVPLMATGVIMAVGYGISLLFVLRAYRIAEHRKVAAREL